MRNRRNLGLALVAAFAVWTTLDSGWESAVLWIGAMGILFAFLAYFRV